METKQKISDIIKFINEKATCGFISKEKGKENEEEEEGEKEGEKETSAKLESGLTTNKKSPKK